MSVRYGLSKFMLMTELTVAEPGGIAARGQIYMGVEI